MEKIEWVEEYLAAAIKLAYDEGHEPALKLLHNVLMEEPGYGRLHNTMGVIYCYEADNAAHAELHFKLAIKFDPGFADPYWHLGNLLYDDDRLDEAIKVFRKGLKARQAKKSQLLHFTGKAYELKKKYGRALEYYKDALGNSAETWDCLLIENSIKRCKRKQR